MPVALRIITASASMLIASGCSLEKKVEIGEKAFLVPSRNIIDYSKSSGGSAIFQLNYGASRVDVLAQGDTLGRRTPAGIVDYESVDGWRRSGNFSSGFIKQKDGLFWVVGPRLPFIALVYSKNPELVIANYQDVDRYFVARCLLPEGAKVSCSRFIDYDGISIQITFDGSNIKDVSEIQAMVVDKFATWDLSPVK